MEFVTTTQLRTKSPQILAQLKLGKSIRLIHRSKVVGTIKPPENEPKVMTEQKLMSSKK